MLTRASHRLRKKVPGEGVRGLVPMPALELFQIDVGGHKDEFLQGPHDRTKFQLPSLASSRVGRQRVQTVTPPSS